MKTENKIIKYSFVISVYNEEESLPIFSKELNDYLENKFKNQYEIIWINDGSIDRSQQLLAELCQIKINNKLINFAQNFGHEMCMMCGIHYATGDAIIVMDADGQHPPASIDDLVQKFQQGDEIVLMVRQERLDSSFLRRTFTVLFYFLLRKLSGVSFEPNATDFFLISQKVKNYLQNNYPDRVRFLRGQLQVLNLKKSFTSFSAPNRIAGLSKYPLSKLFLFSFMCITSHSKVPLHLGLFLGVIMAAFSFIVMCFSLVMYLLGDPPPGYTTIVVLVSLMFSIQFILIGFIGIYIGHNFDEIKKRPHYSIDSSINI
jgi:glycosyltransferase involved in cell wall biosynthesis